MTAEQLAQIVQVVLAMAQHEIAPPADLKARLIKMRTELDAVIALLDTPAPATEKENPVEPPKPVEPIPTTLPTFLEPTEEKKKSGWGKVWNVTKKVLKVAAPVAIAGATGGGSLAAYAPAVITALSDPTVAATTAGGIAGAVATGVRVYGALKPKE